MAIRDIFKISWKTFFNPAGWIDYPFLKMQNAVIYSIIKTLFTSDTPEKRETFEQAVKRLALTEDDVKKTITAYHVYTFIFIVLGFLVFAYAFYLLFGPHSIAGWLLGLGASGLFFGQAFKYDFWALQMQQRKLGMTFNQWKRHRLGDKGSS
ncbi:MAG: hypothetical protein KIT56_05270 [Gammaproteobacteria bacterium]|nr:hypothetical protein [Gammaproteobacteria bacterium]MCW5583285.1 hypothetical protein [Gammaproteobacteria bacterium]